MYRPQLRKIKQRINEMANKLRPQKVITLFLKPDENFNANDYRKQNDLKETDILVIISLDCD